MQVLILLQKILIFQKKIFEVVTDTVDLNTTKVFSDITFAVEERAASIDLKRHKNSFYCKASQLR